MGRTQTRITRQKIGDRLRGKSLSASHRAAISRSRKGLLYDKISREDFFVDQVQRRSSQIRVRLIEKEKWLELCAACGQTPTWNNQFLQLQVDHINGDPFDNRLTNLRFLCPNCHTQTPTYGWRGTRLKNENARNNSIKRRLHCRCKEEVTKNAAANDGPGSHTDDLPDETA